MLASNKLGKIEKIDDLRTIWKHEAHDFSKWLAEEENLSLLGDTIGIDIVLEELESAVGNFNVDLYGTEEGTDRKIIIENQLEDTDHDHLGKIITYASGKNADIIIWIVKHARDEHKQAIEWLNQHTDENIGFYLLEIEVWKIDNSLPAPRFNIIEQPNDWAKTMKSSSNLSETKKLQLNFWEEFISYAFSQKTDFNRVFSRRKPQAQYWYSLKAGSSFYEIDFIIQTQKNLLSAVIYIRNNKELFHKFKSQQEIIEKELGTTLKWNEAKKDCRIIASSTGNIKQSKENWYKYFDWFCSMGLKLRKIIDVYG